MEYRTHLIQSFCKGMLEPIYPIRKIEMVLRFDLYTVTWYSNSIKFRLVNLFLQSSKSHYYLAIFDFNITIKGIMTKNGQPFQACLKFFDLT